MNPSNGQPSWAKSLQKSHSNNEQLEFWRYVSVAYISSKTNFPENEMIKFRSFHHKENQSFLLFTLDRRSNLFQDLEKSAQVEFCWFFPLTREKYRIKSTLSAFYKAKYAEGSEKQQVLSFEDLKDCWNKYVDKEERKLFTELHPDTKTTETNAKKIDDINHFNTPTVEEISENFAIVLADVIEVEHTKFALPQVVADSRHPKFESLFSPYKVTTKYLHRLANKETAQWEIFPLNP